MENVIKINSFLGFGDGHGFGSGSGSGFGSGFGFGFGDGSGSGDALKSLNGDTIYTIDDVLTIIDHIKGNVAKGRIVMGDLSVRQCYVVKGHGLFAHGNTLRDAMTALNDKLFEDMPAGERIEAFVQAHPDSKAYPNTDLFEWHHKLTGSCLAGGHAFVKNHGLSLDGSTTVQDFIKLTENAYNGSIIRKLRPHYGMEA